MIVVAHVMKAEAPIFARAQAPLGRPMGGVLAATGPIAGRIARSRAAVLCGLDPDAVEQRRVELHGYRLCETDAVTRKRLNGHESAFVPWRRPESPLIMLRARAKPAIDRPNPGA